MTKQKKKEIEDKLEKDLIKKGFHKLDSKLISATPPKIKWGKIYQALDDKDKIAYLEKMASTMNHAAFLIQEERNELGELCQLKEEQLEKMSEAMVQNDTMLHGKITKMNEERRKFNESKSGLKGEALKAQLKQWQSLAESQ